MRLLLLFILLSNTVLGQVYFTTQSGAMSKPPSAPAAGTTRILIDFGGNGVADGPYADNGTMTPDNTASNFPKGQAANGKWWNNVVNGSAGTWVSNPVDTANNTISGLTISSNVRPSSTYAADDSSINTFGFNGAVGEYPASACKDNVYFHNGQTVDLTFVIPSGKKATIKFWGNREGAGPRVLQFSLNAGSTYPYEFESAFNQTYTQAVTIPDVIGTQAIRCRVKSGSTFGHISIIDITLTDQ